MTTASKHALMVINKKSETRKATNKLLEMIDDQILDPKDIVLMCVKWMSDYDVAAMLQANAISIEEDTEDDYLD